MRDMKDSGIEWIGYIPNNWLIIPIKYHFKINRGRVISILDLDDDGNYPVYSSQTENDGCLGYLKTYDYSGPSITWTTDGAKAGTVFYRDGKYNCTNVCGILQLREHYKKKSNMHFLAYAIGMVAEQNKRYDINGYKIMSNEMAKIKFAIPSIQSQTIISNFLDRKCSEIDALRLEIEQEIATLKEYKKSIITETVTKGLNKNVPMKDSGIEWIGSIPSAWGVRRINTLYTPRNTKVNDDDYPPLSVTMKGILPQLENVAKTDDHSNRKLVKEGDFVINSRSDRRGSCGISKYNGSVSLINTVLKPFRNISSSYYDWLFHTSLFAEEFYKWGHGIVDDLWSTNWQNMRSIFVTYPSVKEQQQIADYLDRNCSKIDDIIETKNKQLSTLDEYKKSLIYEYVTGKKEVPGV